MKPKLPQDLSDKLESMGTPIDEFSGSLTMLTMFKGGLQNCLLGALLFCTSVYFLLAPLIGSDEGDRFRTVVLLATLGGFALYLWFSLRLPASWPRRAAVIVLIACLLFLSPARTAEKLSFLGGLLGEFLLVMGITFIRLRLRVGGLRVLLSRPRVLVYAPGLVRVNGPLVSVALWHEVRTLWQGARLVGHGTRQRLVDADRYTLDLRNGKKLDFDRSINRVHELGAIVRRETLQTLLPEYLSSFHAGETLHFGKLRVNRESISYETETMPWESIKEVKIDESGNLRIKAPWYTWLTVPARDFPNLHVLQELADYARKAPAGPPGVSHSIATKITDDLLKATLSVSPAIAEGNPVDETPSAAQTEEQQRVRQATDELFKEPLLP
jgi:hypothetical protein